MEYRILLYYNFVPVPDPEAEREAHQRFCDELGIKGRILIAPEGLNGTVSGSYEQMEAYKAYLGSHPLFKDTEFKEDTSDHHAFLKMHVRVKDEIVHFGVKEANPAVRRGKYVEPDEWREMLKRAEEDEDIVILDARSDYEHRVGRFKGATTLPIHNFRELPEQMDLLKDLRGKKIYTYCTGGIKCEKVALFLEDNGFDEVYQLHGGIVRYGKEAGGEDFEGSCYVFDQRVVVPVNEVNPTVVGKCELCEAPTERMINCANAECNKHFLICDGCAEKMEGCCSAPCMEAPRRRAFDGKGYYLRGVNSKSYVEEPHS